MTKIAQYILTLLIIALTLPKIASAEAIVCEPDPGTNMLVKYSDSVLCVFEGASDVDVYRFVANAGDRPFIQVVSPSSKIILYAPSGELLAQTGFSGTVDIDHVVLQEDGIHTVVVEAHPNADNWDYTLELPCLAGKCSNAPLPESLGYTAVSPCRIVDTRFGLGGALAAGEIRHYRSYGDVRNQNQAAGGLPAGFDYPEECPFPLGEHAAVNLNVTVVSSTGGFATLWPWNEVRPAASFINFGNGTVIANAGVVKTTASAGTDPDFSVYSDGNTHVIIDVLGYYTQ